ncbi:MAG: DUF1805 domain-containing protein [Methanimicrococcus sp.]|nr:DUF1805 domain-containing protein [Methanimicrococcus sp.]
MISKKLTLEGKEFDAYSVMLDSAPFLLIRAADKSFLACGFLDISAADRLFSCAAKVSGVKTFEDMLAAEIIAVTKKAEEKGVVVGMSGKEALLKF